MSTNQGKPAKSLKKANSKEYAATGRGLSGGEGGVGSGGSFVTFPFQFLLFVILAICERRTIDY